MAQITYLGAGLIGGGLAEAAARRGDTVRAWNRTAARAEALAAFGVQAVADVRAAVRGAERVHIALSDDASVDGVLDTIGLDALQGALVIDHTTTGPAGTLARAERLADAGVAFLHAPVFMSPAMCRNAAGLMLASGPEAVYGRAAEALAAMTGSVRYLGTQPDKAATIKLMGNAMLITIVGGLADVFALATNAGLSAGDAMSLFEAFNPAMVLQYRGRMMAEGDYTPNFELTMARKDVRLMLEAAGDLPLAVLPGIAARMDALIAAGYGADDLGVLAIDAVPARPAP